MPRERLSMRKIKDLLRLKYQQRLSHRQIAASLGIAVGSVHEYLQRAQDAKVTWPQAEQIPESQLETSLFPSVASLLPDDDLALPDWPHVTRELTGKGVTLCCCGKNIADHPTGLGYSQFCRRFAHLQRHPRPTHEPVPQSRRETLRGLCRHDRRTHRPRTGQITQAQIFVATLGASSYTYAEATLTQSVPDWIGAHVRAFAFFGGTPELLVCDNLRSGITKRLLLPPRCAAHLSGDGRPLWDAPSYLPACETPRQTQGRIGGTERRTTRARPPAQSHLLQPGHPQ